MAPIRNPNPGPVEYLINLRFPAYRALHASMGSGRTFEERQALEEQVEQYRQELMGKSEADLEALFAGAQTQKQGERRMKAEAEEQTYFYNRPDAMADFGFWSIMVSWKLEEGIALVFGRCPKKVTWEKLQRYLATSFATRFGNLRDLVARASAAGMLVDPVPPGAFLAFAKRSGFSPPAELVAALAEKGVPIADWKTLHDAAKADAERLALEVTRLTGEVAQANVARTELEQQVQQLKTKLSDWEFDHESPTYPVELDIAMQAWAANSRSPNPPANPREAVDRWLRSNFPDLPDAARERISIICNWNKLGGRGRPKKQK